MMKKGIALMITISMIAVITAIVYTTLRLLDHSFTQTQSIMSITQNQQILDSFLSSFKKLTKDIDSPEALELLMGEFPSLGDPSGAFEMRFSIRPLQGKLNLNTIINQNKELLEEILKFYYPGYHDQFISLVADTIDIDSEQDMPQTELVLYKTDFSQGFLGSIEEVLNLVHIYQGFMRDTTVLQNVPWEELFYLHDDENSTIDCNYMPPIVAQLLKLELKEPKNEPVSHCADLYIDYGDQNETLSRYNIAPFSKGKPYVVEVEVHYEIEGHAGGFYAHYDFHTQRISHLKALNF